MIEPIDKTNLIEVLPLIRMYQEFYQVNNIDDVKNKEFFAQFGPRSDKGCLFGYRKGNKLVAFSTVYFSYSSTICSKVGIMNDLFTLRDFRNQGIATELIKYCEIYAKSHGAVRLQWLTSATNKKAHSIYNSIGAVKSSWQLYTYET